MCIFCPASHWGKSNFGFSCKTFLDSLQLHSSSCAGGRGYYTGHYTLSHFISVIQTEEEHTSPLQGDKLLLFYSEDIQLQAWECRCPHTLQPFDISCFLLPWMFGSARIWLPDLNTSCWGTLSRVINFLTPQKSFSFVFCSFSLVWADSCLRNCFDSQDIPCIILCHSHFSSPCHFNKHLTEARP